jgi:hypothetical protein
MPYKSGLALYVLHKRYDSLPTRETPETKFLTYFKTSIVNGNSISSQASLWLLSAAEIDDRGKLRTGMDANTFMSELLTLGNDTVRIKK